MKVLFLFDELCVVNNIFTKLNAFIVFSHGTLVSLLN
jgi:hypothetical protein